MTNRSRWYTWLGIGLGVAGLGWLAVAVVEDWPGTVAAIRRVGAGGAVASLAAMLVAEAAFAWIWGRNAGAGRDPGFTDRDAMVAYFVSGWSRFLPGGVLPYVSRVGAAGRFGGRPASATVAVGVETALSSAAAMTHGVVAIATGLVAERFDIRLLSAGVVVLVVGSVIAVRSAPRLLERWVSDLTSLSAGAIARSFVGYLVAWTAIGGSLWLIADRAAGGLSWQHAAGAVGIAWFAGLVALPVPSGLGVREAVLTGLLGPTIGFDVAVAAAVAHRLVWTAAILVGGLAGFAAIRRRE